MAVCASAVTYSPMGGDPLKNYVFIMSVLLVFALGLLAYSIWSSWGEATVSLILSAQHFAG